ncbi:MAG TPA: nuclear transport factor 2 family protein [Marmoricola sp.]|jgi:hypothetical protein|nr:nuclear transport factor 2 family protein [Marmoricola sp.]
MKTITLAEAPTVIIEHLAAVNRFDVEGIVGTFASDAYVNDARREIRGADAICSWITEEMVGDSVTIDAVEVLDHYGDVILRGRYDGTYDKANLPEELIMTNYFTIRDNRIVALTVVFNQPSAYDA